MVQLIFRKTLLVLLLLTSLHLDLKSQNTFEFKKQIEASTDDAEERQTGGQIDITSSDIELVNDGSTTGNQNIGLRFTKINIPKDATIVNAYIQFWVDENTHTTLTNLTITGEAIDNSLTFSTAPYNVTNRIKTTASVAWSSLPVWTLLNEAGTNQRTPNIKTVLDEIRAKSGWIAGNAITIFINGTGRRNAHAFDGIRTMAPQLVIEYKLKSIPVTVFPITKNDIWSYNDSGLNLGSNWKNTNYVDSTWPFYIGKFGYGEGNEKTVLSYGSNASNKHITSYFRKKFTILDSTTIDTLLFKILVDDGAVVYLNGNEIFRRNMPTGVVSYNTTANNSIYGLDENVYFEYRIGAKLRNGINTLAVEVHQSDPESVDLGFDLEVVAKKQNMKTTNFPIIKGDEWYFNDNGIELYGSNWTKENYANETFWDYGKAPLGYGDPMTTTLSFGPNAANKHVTYFFRKKIFISDTSKLVSDKYDFNIRRDDGAVVFVNGVEVLRQNMPLGDLNFRSISSSIIDGTNETTYFTTTLPKSIFKNGINQIAVAIHQRDSISSDLGFDMEIVKNLKPNPVAMGCQDGENHISCFTSVLPQAQTTSMIIPTTHNFQQILKQGAAYTLNAGTIPASHDFTAYIGRNGSSKNGVLSVNHENTPGGVSLAYLRYIDSTQLWTVDSSRSVDFGVAGIVTTARNCSGGITPWGTVITSEETFTTTDANGDGYSDVGWNVEINPWTGKILDYGTGSPQKLWALGRMSHENVVIANDSQTVYQGEDGGSNLVYKFIADKKMNLSEGKLYVLKINLGLTAGEPNGPNGIWIRVPNTTKAERNNTNSLALAVGGTQFNGIEDVEIGTKDGKVYFTAKGLNRTYRFKDGDSTFTEFEVFVGNKSYQINTGTSIITEPWASGNDNLTFDDKGNLYVLQDGSRNHLWMVRPDHTQEDPKIEMFMTSPIGSEPTGMTFTPDYKFMFCALQHPSSTNVNQLDATGNQVRFNAAAIAVIAKKENIGVALPTVAIKANKQIIRVGDSVKFDDLSYPIIQNRTWIFSGTTDSINTLKNPVIVYNKVGEFNVKITAKNKVGSTERIYDKFISVLPALPMVNFTQSATNVFVGDSIVLTDLTKNGVQQRKWTINSATYVLGTEVDSIIKIKFNTKGTYSVKLFILNAGGKDSLIKTALIKVNPTIPNANFTSDKTIIFKNEEIAYTDLSTGEITTRLWKFTGGLPATSPNKNVNVTYASKGVYAVELTVSNESGSKTSLKNAYVTVNDRTTSVYKIENIADFTIYPNPVLKDLNIKLNLEIANNVTIDIFDINGKLISKLFNKTLAIGINDLKLNISQLNLVTGEYLVSVKIGNKAITSKIIKN